MVTNEQPTNQPGDPRASLLLTSVRRQSFAISGTLYNVPKRKWPGRTNQCIIGIKYKKDDVSVIIVDFIAQEKYEEKYIIGWEWFWKEGNHQFQGLIE